MRGQIVGTLWEWVDSALALTSDSANVVHVLVRCSAIYAATMAMIRMAGKRLIGKDTAFEVVLAVMLGSTASRAITDGTTALGKIFASLTLVLLHLVLSKLSFHSNWSGTLIKGAPRVLVRDGRIQWDAMAKAAITETDLRGMLRSQASSRDLDQVRWRTWSGVAR